MLAPPSHEPPIFERDDFARHAARLLIALYICGQPVNSLLEGESRVLESKARLARVDFWLREPGHLALALLYSYGTLPTSFQGREPLLRAALDRAIADNAADVRRVPLRGASLGAARLTAYLDAILAFLSGTAVVSDRPGFQKGSRHLIILETPGLDFAQKLLSEAPMLSWYQVQGETIREFMNVLETLDLTVMPYLAPDITPALAMVQPFTPVIRERYARLFTDQPNA